MLNSKELRAEIKNKFGYNSRQVSVKTKLYYGTTLTVRDTKVEISKIQDFAEQFGHDCEVDKTEEVFNFHAKNYTEKIKDFIPTLEKNLGICFEGIAVLFLARFEYYIDVRMIDRTGENETIGTYHRDCPEQIAYAIKVAEERIQLDKTEPKFKVGDVFIKAWGDPDEHKIIEVNTENNRIFYQVESLDIVRTESESEMRYFKLKADYLEEKKVEAAYKAREAAEQKRWNDNNMDYLTPTECQPVDEQCDFSDKVNTLADHYRCIKEYPNKQKVRCVGIIEVTDEQYNLYKNDLFRDMKFFVEYGLGHGSDKDFGGKSFLELKDKALENQWREHSFFEAYKFLNIETKKYFYVANWWNSYARYIFTPVTEVANKTKTATPAGTPQQPQNEDANEMIFGQR